MGGTTASEYPLLQTVRAIRQADWGRYGSLDFSRKQKMGGCRVQRPDDYEVPHTGNTGKYEIHSIDKRGDNLTHLDLFRNLMTVCI